MEVPITWIRYIRDFLNQSSANIGNHWVEIQALEGATNRALSKVPTSNSTFNASYPITRITDWDLNSANYAGASFFGNVWVQVDLLAVYPIDTVKVWHYFADSRTYYKTKTQVSKDGIKWYDIFDSGVSWVYVETSWGKISTITYNEVVEVWTVRVLVVAWWWAGGMDMWGGGWWGWVISTTTTLPLWSNIIKVWSGWIWAPSAWTLWQPTAHQYTKPATNWEHSSIAGLYAIWWGYGGSSYALYTPWIRWGSGGSWWGASWYNNGAILYQWGRGSVWQGNIWWDTTAQYRSWWGWWAWGAWVSSPNLPHWGAWLLDDILWTNYYWGGWGWGAWYTIGWGNWGIWWGWGWAVLTTTWWAWLNNWSAWGWWTTSAQTNTPWWNWWANTGWWGWWGSHYNSNNKGWDWGAWIVVISYATDWSDWIWIKSTGWIVTTVWTQTVHTFLSNWTFNAVSATSKPILWGLFLIF